MYSIIYKIPHPDDINYVFDYLIRPFAFGCAVLPILCYIGIFLMSWRARSRMGILDPALAAKRKREVWRSLQFAFVFVFYVLLWLAFEAHPYLPHNHPSIFSFEIYVAICDCITTGLIQGVMNQRIRNTLIKMFTSVPFGCACLKQLGGQKLARVEPTSGNTPGSDVDTAMRAVSTDETSP